MGALALAQVLRPLTLTFKPEDFPQLLVGLERLDDAAVYQLNEQQAIVQTVDFFPPIVDDPYTFGAIAAANAMSDVYAMGGEVLLALALAGFPEDLDLGILEDIFRGGADKVRQAGGVIAGGHTIIDREPKYGLMVTGLVDPRHVTHKHRVEVGDMAVLTKPLGTGVISTALRAQAASEIHTQSAIDSMLALNRRAGQIMVAAGVDAATDVTGFGLLGHAYEMIDQSGVGLRLHWADLPILDGALHYAAAGYIPGGTHRNEAFMDGQVRLDYALAPEERALLFDPQTSGGLLIFANETEMDSLTEAFTAGGQAYWLIGEAIEGQGIEVRRS